MSEVWPASFRRAVEDAFGGPLNNSTFQSVDIRVSHAFKVWRNRYEMTPEQDDYAWDLLRWSVRSSARAAAGAKDVKHPYMYIRKAVTAGLERVVNDPTGHEGFKRRSGRVDVTGLLRGLVA